MTNSQRNQQVALGFLGLFGILAILVKIHAGIVFQLDQAGLDAVAELGAHVGFWEILTTLGSPILTGGLIVILAAVLLYWRQPFWGEMVAIGLVGGDGLLLVLKHLMGRPRPSFQVIADTGFSFPSGHVFSTTLLAIMVITVLCGVLRHNWIFWLAVTMVSLIVLGVILGRLGLRNHYPTDVLGSLLLAVGWWFQVVSLGERRWGKSLVEKWGE
ncbi:phosphatase PAP2 family protein [Levilactobacillus humaensis]|uniref:phosphatase PAP2 family protein n=1 Tax=Levilactobacillus humaensis TaxID=2950375 RepID=UPI0021C295BB|nr:phosphatase PAP2 family protein [Levilactobacillus humaensis]